VLERLTTLVKTQSWTATILLKVSAQQVSVCGLFVLPEDNLARHDFATDEMTER
jgi:hypothetical protein